MRGLRFKRENETLNVAKESIVLLSAVGFLFCLIMLPISLLLWRGAFVWLVALLAIFLVAGVAATGRSAKQASG